LKKLVLETETVWLAGMDMYCQRHLCLVVHLTTDGLQGNSLTVHGKSFTVDSLVFHLP